jgi:hypothetical protein
VLGDLFCFCNFVVVVVAAQHKKGKREMGFYVFNQNFFFWRFDDFDSRF